MKVGKAIDIALATEEMTIEDLADKMNVSVQRIHSIRRRESCNTTTIERLAKAFGMTMTEFVQNAER